MLFEKGSNIQYDILKTKLRIKNYIILIVTLSSK